MIEINVINLSRTFSVFGVVGRYTTQTLELKWLVCFITSTKGGYVFGRVGLFVYLSVSSLVGLFVCRHYLQSNEQICMKRLPDVSRAKEQSIKFWGYPDRTAVVCSL